MRKFTSIILAIILTLFSGILIPTNNVSAETEPIAIDMYLIGGQSNAVGYSSKGNLSDTFENVGYAGAVDHFLSNGTYRTENIDSFSEYKRSVAAGLGKTSGFIGPEYFFNFSS